MFYLTMHSPHFIYGYMASDPRLKIVHMTKVERHGVIIVKMEINNSLKTVSRWGKLN